MTRLSDDSAHPAHGYLSRRLEADAARSRLARFGAHRFEPAWLPLWGIGIGISSVDVSGEADAWLLASDSTPRALLWPGTLGAGAQPPAGDMVLAGTASPAIETFERLWLWERLARPRHWRLRVRPETCRPVTLPLWLGYRDGHRTRLIVLSGVSGEPLGALKPAVLAGLGANPAPFAERARR